MTLYLNVGDEDLGPDSLADISAAPTDHGMLIHYDIASKKVILPDSDEIFPAGKGRMIHARGNRPKRSVEVEFELYEMEIR